MPENLYLDAIATTRISGSVRERMLPFLDEAYGLPSGAHTLALDARDAVEVGRQQCLQFIDAPDRAACIFTGSGTEANNLGLLGYARAQGRNCRVVTSAIEHPSILGACAALEGEGHEIIRLKVDSTGGLPPDMVAEVLAQGDLLVTHLANYDIGTRQALRELGEIARKVNAAFMVDATFGAAWNELSMKNIGADLVTLAPHRFFGPAGIGVLLVRPGIELKPLYYGGSQEFGWRPGSSSVANQVGAGAACAEAVEHQQRWQELAGKRQCEFVHLLGERLPEFQLNGTPPGAGRDPHHLSLSIRGVEGEAILLNLDLKGVSLTSNTGCVTASDKVSPVLQAIGTEMDMAAGTIVIGILPEHSSQDVVRAIDLLVSAVERIRGMSQAWHQFQSRHPR